MSEVSRETIMRAAIATAILALTLPSALAAQDDAPIINREAQVDYQGFADLTKEVLDYRMPRLVDAEEFNQRAAKDNVLILDTRSAAAFAAGHVEGAVNLPFSEFTDDKLRKVIGDDQDREILIYCNNNFAENAPPIPLKRAPLALNIPTFINLYGYGYRNVYELDGSYWLADKQIAWAGEIPNPGRLSGPVQLQLRQPE
ncbi:rhodanese-like domain-containing protein [Alterisphingorhabdus coralli]|uniref:Rhodanese-like domain-containing protein n=1 Tax=Alterisphingorhabdus coralli TaxID=3071408 RepID=A0AA97F708_9SPHN|nr:rhodanese-like domain-containing protein [Parasphingorhabdus sp. SCSIO 66989]WOE74631.1 rhodanese-like domain-containing protein [Parasphingorhabdus sp. SCSIO 66989]